jgi:hypothetical protein
MKISDLSDAEALQGTELLEVSQTVGGDLKSRRVALSVLQAYLGSGGSGYLDNLSASTDPGAADDSSLGYSAGSTWFNVSSGEIFRCLDAAEGAAVWAKTSLTLDELGSMATVNDAPSDGNSYVRKNGAWSLAPTGGSSAGASIKVISGTNYTLEESDSGKTLWCTSDDPVIITFPGSTALTMGANVEGAIIQAGDGPVSVQGDSDSDVVAEGDKLSTSAKWAPLSFFRQSANLWWLGGQRV